MNACAIDGELYQVTSGHYCAGLVVAEGVVIHAAPILRWAIGKPFGNVRHSLEAQGQRVDRVEAALATCPTET